jgi:hypothetical protein
MLSASIWPWRQLLAYMEMEIYQDSQSNQERSAGIHQDRSGVRASLHAMEDAEAV